MKHLALILMLAPPAAADIPGYDRFDLTAAHRARPVAASICYPAAAPSYVAPIGGNPIFRPTPAFVGAPIAEGAHPLVLLSHGSGGNADGLGWLSSGLALRGAIVLAVDHPGSTSGDSSPRRSTDLRARAGDLSAALDSVLADPSFAPFIDPERISVTGFSLGGSTALTLAGLRFDGAAQQANCETGPDAADCGWFLRGGVDFRTAQGFSDRARDGRINRAVAIDPGFGGAIIEDSILASVPVHFINLGDPADRMAATDVGPSGHDLIARLHGVTYTEIAPAFHFTFLGACTEDAPAILEDEGDDPVCTDPSGTDRIATHRRLIEDIAAVLGL